MTVLVALNWSFRKKLAIILIVGFGSCLYAATIAPLLNSGLVVISIDLHKKITDITLVSGYQLLLTGASGPFVCAGARKIGKRPIFLLSGLFGLIGSIIGCTATTYNQLLAARLVQGLAISAYESIAVSMIADIFFVHERGLYMSGMQLILGGVSNASSIITGAIVANLGWHYLFNLLVVFIGIQLILQFLFVPETAYRRDRRYEIDEVVNQELETLANVEHRHANRSAEDTDEYEMTKMTDTKLETVTTNMTVSTTFYAIPEKKTFWQEKAVYTGTYTDDNFLQLVIAPLAVCSNLVVSWIVVVSGTITACYVAQAFVLAQIFFYPPYNLSAAGVGYLSIGPFVGGILAAAALSVSLDPMIQWATRKNKGVYEPEYRLLSMLGGLFAGIGLVLFGYLCQISASYYATATMHGMVLFGIIFVTTGTSAYAVDAYRDMSNEIFIMGMMFKNFLFYGWSYFINDWEAKSGPLNQFGVWSAVAFALVLSTPVVFIWGKRYRSHWARNNVLDKLHIKTHSEI